ncbi:MAG: hypothetical protein KGZ42_09650 [Melioribacter sp.]|nr:hypothetical protein [Melioribacter sp.]
MIYYRYRTCLWNDKIHLFKYFVLGSYRIIRRFKIKAYLILFLFCLQTVISAQTYFGIHLEPITYLANVEKVSFNPLIKTKELSIEGNLGITFSLTQFTDEKIGISLRPGIILGYIYFGYDIGLFWSYNLDSDMYIISGLNAHYNLPRAASNSAASERVLLPFLVIGGGYRISEDLLTEIQINLSLNNVNYGWERDMQSGPLYKTTWNYYKVPWMIKISIAHSWEL